MDYVGHDKAWRQFSKACDSGKTHHGWILAGARGLGKSAFALKAASALVDPTNVHANLIARGSHPDILWVKRLPKDAPKDDEDVTDETELKRSITVDQIRSVQQVLTSRPGLSDQRAIIIDSADDRARCQILRFEPLCDADMAEALQRAAPEASQSDLDALVRLGNGAPGQALDFLGLRLDELEDAMASILRSGDRDNAIRIALAEKLSLKAAQPRYEAFLRRAPALIAEHTRMLGVSQLRAGIDAWEAASGLAARAIALSLDKQSVVFQMGSLLASVQAHKAS
jgi:DNA polymerase-3 subunit delta'